MAKEEEPQICEDFSTSLNVAALPDASRGFQRRSCCTSGTRTGGACLALLGPSSLAPGLTSLMALPFVVQEVLYCSPLCPQCPLCSCVGPDIPPKVFCADR